MTQKNNSERILLVLPNNLGDVIMATPVLEGLRSRYEHGWICFLVESGFEAPLIALPFCNEIICFPRRQVRDTINSPLWQKGCDQLNEFITSLNARSFTTIINLSQAQYIARLLSLVDCGTFLGQRFLPQGVFAIHDPWSRYLYAIPFARRFNELHAVDTYRRIAGVTTHRGGYSTTLTETEQNDARRILTGAGVDPDSHWLLFQPGAAMSSKCWPIEHFVQLGELLLARKQQIVVSGSTHEQELAQALAGRLGTGGAVSLAGTMSFRQALAVCSLASACVTPDTAIMHAAAAFNVPVFALFGATSPLETGPWGDGHFVLSARCGERPCFCTECKTMLCMKSISPQDVYNVMQEGENAKGVRCDVYRTTLAPNGDYSLRAVSPNAHEYCDTVGARLVRRAFEPATLAGDSAESFHGELSLGFTEIVGSMRAELDRFFASAQVEHIRAFEQGKERLAALGGIADFWSALLNLALNSIPLLDPRKGVSDSAAACAELQARIEQALTSY